MRIVPYMALLAAFALWITLPAFAADASGTQEVRVSTSVTPESSSQTPKDEAKNEQELKLYSDFVRFSDSWMQRLNSSNSEGRSKMVVVQENGKYKARYHLLEKKSSVVRESPTRPGQYTGILRYHDVVYEAEGDTETATKNGPFSPVAGSAHAVSEIFQFMNGGWR